MNNKTKYNNHIYIMYIVGHFDIYGFSISIFENHIDLYHFEKGNQHHDTTMGFQSYVSHC
jgi:hypothetical protein